MAEEDPTTRNEPRPRRVRKRSAADGIRSKEFPPAMRGYERSAVDAWREEVAELVRQLEDQAPRDAAVKRALEEVGKETSSILQRAHEAADDIASRSRSQAEGRLQRAEREAEITVTEAEARVRELDEDYKRIWEERTRLLEEMRQLADDVLGVADDAADRIEGPREADPITEENESVESSPEPKAEPQDSGEEESSTAVVPPPAWQGQPKP
jgi:DivIVA domain-containing protein